MDYKVLKKIKAARHIQGFNQKAIADQLAVSIPTYSRFERGITKTDYNLLKKVCSLLDLNFNDLGNESFDDLLNKQSNNDTVSNINSQLITLTRLLEEQQKTNQMVMKKLTALENKIDALSV